MTNLETTEQPIEETRAGDETPENFKQPRPILAELADRRIKEKLKREYRRIKTQKFRRELDAGHADSLLDQVDNLAMQTLGEPALALPPKPPAKEWTAEEITDKNLLEIRDQNTTVHDCVYLENSDSVIYGHQSRNPNWQNSSRNLYDLYKIDMKTQEPEEPFTPYSIGASIFDVALSPDEEIVALGTHSGEPHQLIVLSTKEKDAEGKAKVLAEIKTGSTVSDIDFDPYSELLAASMDSGRKYQVDVYSIFDKDENGQPKLLFNYPIPEGPDIPHENFPRAVKFSPDGSMLAMGTNKFRLLSVELSAEDGKPEVLAEIDLNDDETEYQIAAIDFSHDGRYVAVAAWKMRDVKTNKHFSYGETTSMIFIFSLEEKDKKGQPKIVAKQDIPGTANSINFHPLGNNFIVTEYENRATVYSFDNQEVRERSLITPFRGKHGKKSAFTKSGDKIWTGSGDNMDQGSRFAIYGETEKDNTRYI